MIRVALVTYGMVGGGISSFILNLGSYLKRNNYDVTIVTTDIQGTWFEKISIRGLKAIHIEGLCKQNPIQHVSKVVATLYDGQFDVVLLNYALIAQVGIGLGKAYPVVIPIVHGVNEYAVEMSTYNAERCSRMVAVSPAVANIIKRRSVGCRPIQTIIHGVPLLEDKKGIIRNYYEPSIKLLYVGRMVNGEKGVFLLPEILSLLINSGILVTMDVAGEGRDLQELKSRFQSAGVDKYVTYWGDLDAPDVYNLMSRDHILLFPSYEEGLGLVPIEAQMCGCIPVASLLKGATDCIINDRETGFLAKPGDVSEFCDFIKGLYNNRELLKSMSERSEEYARTHLTIEIMVKKYLDLMVTALDNPAVASKTPFDNDSYKKSYKEKIVDKKVIYFGTGSGGENLYSVLPLKAAYFVDNNPKKWNSQVHGLPVYTPEVLNKESKEKIIIIIASQYIEDISRQLKQMGFTENVNFFNVFKLLEPELLLQHYLLTFDLEIDSKS